VRSFEWIDARNVAEAVRLLSTDDAIAKAGGMDVLDLMKEGLLRPQRVVNLLTIADLADIRVDEQGLHLGANATLARIAQDPRVRTHFSILAAAAGHAATPQVRNVATIAGNLLQRPRDWYFRNEHFATGHDPAALARAGQNQYLAIFDNAHTAMVHASTPATALTALDASVHLTGPHGQRSIPLNNFLLPPDAARPADAAIERGEVLTHVTVPRPAGDVRMAYHKQTERESYDWPICDVAVVLTMENRTVQSARIVMGWVAPTPRLATASPRYLAGRAIDEESASEAARMAVADATPLSRNHYKVQVLEAVIRRTLLAATTQG
jgi:xanthine dehydrogenase YagS FAD-binding subunit